jgi:hypothetical protein
VLGSMAVLVWHAWRGAVKECMLHVHDMKHTVVYDIFEAPRRSGDKTAGTGFVRCEAARYAPSQCIENN